MKKQVELGDFYGQRDLNLMGNELAKISDPQTREYQKNFKVLKSIRG
jgi:hypothetical protein